MARFSLVPQNTRFDELLASAGVIAEQAAHALLEMVQGYPETMGMVAKIKDLEHQGDRIVRELVTELNATFITPIDREDIYDLMGALDDVIDHIDEGAALFDTYAVEKPTDTVRRQAEVLVGATHELVSALKTMSKPAEMEGHWSRLHALEDEGDALLRSGIKEVFASCYHEPAIIICWKDIYTQFEEAIDSCERAATVLESVAVKNR